MHVPKYRQLANALRDRIRAGDYQPGDRIPTEPALSSEFGIDRGTVRQGIAVLRREGLISVEHGRGSFVRKQRQVRRNLVASLQREYELAAAGEEPEGGLFKELTGEAGDVDVPTEYDWVEATEDLADAFGVPEGTALLRRQYLHFIDGQPHQCTRSYLLADMVEGTPIAEKSCERPGFGTIGQLASIGVRVDRAELGMRTWLATPEDMEALRMREGEPVIGYRRVVYAARRPVEVADVASPGEQVVQEIVVDFGGDS